MSMTCFTNQMCHPVHSSHSTLLCSSVLFWLSFLSRFDTSDKGGWLANKATSKVGSRYHHWRFSEVFGLSGRFNSLLLPEPIQGPTKPPMQKSETYTFDFHSQFSHASASNHILCPSMTLNKSCDGHNVSLSFALL